MRRKDRELTSKDDLTAILNACQVLRLGMCDQGAPYVVPLNFGYVWEETLTFYCHCALTGRKLEVLAANPQVCVELDCEHRLTPGQEACEWGFDYASVIAMGQARVLGTRQEKLEGLSVIMAHLTGRGDFAFPDAALDRVCVLAIPCDEVTGKRRKSK